MNNERGRDRKLVNSDNRGYRSTDLVGAVCFHAVDSAIDDIKTKFRNDKKRIAALGKVLAAVAGLVWTAIVFHGFRND